MQTFLPYEDFKKSLACLDKKRLGKQRVEARQILNALDPSYDKKGWRNHPAVLMWKGYENALIEYYNLSLIEWALKGGRNIKLQPIKVKITFCDLPHWLGNEEFHASHRSNLLRKDPNYYGQFGWSEGPDLPYVWPVSS